MKFFSKICININRIIKKSSKYLSSILLFINTFLFENVVFVKLPMVKKNFVILIFYSVSKYNYLN